MLTGVISQLKIGITVRMMPQKIPNIDRCASAVSKSVSEQLVNLGASFVLSTRFLTKPRTMAYASLSVLWMKLP